MRKKRKNKKRKRRLKKSVRYFIFIFIILLIVFEFNSFLNKDLILEVNNGEKELEIEREKQKKQELELKYQECLKAPYNEKDNTDILTEEEEKITKYLKNNYRTSIKYQDILTSYTYTYNSNQNYYAASTIKTLDAIYIYTKASNNEISLDETIPYLAKYKRGSSLGMQKHKIGEEITLRDLVKYAITVSDNTAHEMLVNYIGFNNLKEFGKSLGAKTTLVGSDNFGTINVEDAIIYIDALNDLFNNSIYKDELKEYFLHSDQNYLGFPEENIVAAQKYGEYDIYYHEIGIVYTNNPYMVAILTTHGNGNYERVIRNINNKMKELNELFYSQREEYCSTILEEVK